MTNKQRRFRFQLSTLLIITTVSAAAFSALAQTGIVGAVVCLYGSWLGVLAAISMQRARRCRGLRRLGYALLATACVAVALILFFLAGLLNQRA